MEKGRKRVDLSVFTEEQILEIIRFYGIETIKDEIRLDSKSVPLNMLCSSFVQVLRSL